MNAIYENKLIFNIIRDCQCSMNGIYRKWEKRNVLIFNNSVICFYYECSCNVANFNSDIGTYPPLTYVL